MNWEVVLVKGFSFICIIVCLSVVYLTIKTMCELRSKEAVLPLKVYVYDYDQNILKNDDFFRMKNKGDTPPEDEIEFVNYFIGCDDFYY